MTTGLFPSTYFGPISLYSQMQRCENVQIEQWEHYKKQTYRNRCHILTANKVMDLIVPVARPAEGIPMRDVRIAYQQDWQRIHWNAIESAYNTSPYFEYFAEDLLPFFEKKEVFLLELNEKIRETVMSLMQIKTEVRKTNSYVENPENTTDYRSSFNPKSASNTGKPYYQVFDHKFGFVADLSILDLLFNEGTEGILYLTE